MNPEIAEQLRRNDIDAVHVLELGTLGDKDADHLQRATEIGRMLCTQDADFLRLHSEGLQHAGVAYGSHYYAIIGGWVKALRNLHDSETAEDVIGQVRYLRVK